MNNSSLTTKQIHAIVTVYHSDVLEVAGFLLKHVSSLLVAFEYMDLFFKTTIVKC
jgi:hypothetical protein